MQLLPNENTGNLGLGQTRLRRIYFIFFFVGFVSQIAQVVFLREFMRLYYGLEITLGLVLGLWMFWTCLGSAACSFLHSRMALPRRILALGLILFALSLPATVYFIRDSRRFFEVGSGDYLHASSLLLSGAILAAPSCFCLGFLFSTAAKETREASAIYICESVGCCLGGLAFTFLLSSADSLWVTGASSVFLLGMCVLLIKKPAMKLALPCMMAVVLFGAWKATFISHQNFWKNLNPQFRLIEHRPSKFGDLDLLFYDGQYNLYQQGHLLFSMPDRGESKPLTHLILAQHENPRNVLLIGGGMTGMLKEILRHPVGRVEYVELDPDLLLMARKYASMADQAALQDPRVALISGDGRLFLRQTAMRYDVIIVNPPDPTTASANRFATLEFFRSAADHLTKNGVLALNGLTSHTHYAAPEFLRRNRSVYATLSGVFPQVLAVPGASSSFLASRGKMFLSLDEFVVLGRLEKKGISEAIDIYPLTEKFYIEKINHELLTGRQYNPLDQNSPEILPVAVGINRDRHPVTYYFSILLWLHLSNDPLFPAMEFLGTLQGWRLWIPMAVLAAGFLVLWMSKRRKEAVLRRFSAALCIFMVGFYGIALEILALLSFQSAVGYVYPWLGGMLALFMFGLALGARSQSSAINPARRLLELHLGLVLLLIVSFLFLFGSTNQTTAFLVNFTAIGLAGFFVGAFYPILLRLFPRGGAATGGLLYAGDLAGGLAGALLVSPIFLPLWGVDVVFKLLVSFCLLSLIICALTYPSRS